MSTGRGDFFPSSLTMYRFKSQGRQDKVDQESYALHSNLLTLVIPITV